MTARVLLVEDDALISSSLSRAVRARGYDVQTADTVAGALAEIDGTVPDLVLLDLSAHRALIRAGASSGHARTNPGRRRAGPGWGGALVADAEPSIVAVHDSIAQTDVFGRQVEGQAAGTGFVLAADGVVVTNDHVVDGATDITVDLSDGEEVAANVPAADPGSDLAVLRVDPGDDITVTDRRDGRSHTVTVTLRSRPAGG